MVKIRQAIVVEGRYDKNALSQIVDATIFETSGFGIFHNEENIELLRRVAKARGLIVFTDSDGGGFVIRNYLKSAIDPKYLLHAYIPDVYGKEKRKSAPGREGKLGVEGMAPAVILECLRRAGATFDNEDVAPNQEPVTKADLFEMGLSGTVDSKTRRLSLLRKLDFPEHMSANAMLQAVNVLYTKEELRKILEEL